MNDIPFAVCSKCQHYRVRPKPELYNLSDLQTPGVLKSKLEWDQQDHERRLEEMQRFKARIPFNYEPYHYPWCAAYTPFDKQLLEEIDSAIADGDLDKVKWLAKESVARGKELVRRAHTGDMAALHELAENGRATMNPVNGEIMQIFALCAQMNPTGRCPLFEPKDIRTGEVSP